jgi:hypothetical protein
MTQDVLNQIADFVSKGGNDPELLDSTMRKFGTSGYVKPEDILRVYNTYSPHGPAIETPEELSKKYGIKSTETAEQRNRKSALKPALLAIDKALGETYKQTGPVNFLERLKVEKLGGLGANQELVRQNQAFQLLRQNVVRALQGARMSDIDIELAQQYIPNIGDTADTINTKLIGLKSFVEGLVGIGSTEVRPPLSSFEY